MQQLSQNLVQQAMNIPFMPGQFFGGVTTKSELDEELTFDGPSALLDQGPSETTPYLPPNTTLISDVNNALIQQQSKADQKPTSTTEPPSQHQRLQKRGYRKLGDDNDQSPLEVPPVKKGRPDESQQVVTLAKQEENPFDAVD